MCGDILDSQVGSMQLRENDRRYNDIEGSFCFDSFSNQVRIQQRIVPATSQWNLGNLASRSDSREVMVAMLQNLGASLAPKKTIQNWEIHSNGILPFFE